MADRSINDLTQYPVFPWVVADYTSKTLGKQGPRYNISEFVGLEMSPGLGSVFLILIPTLNFKKQGQHTVPLWPRYYCKKNARNIGGYVCAATAVSQIQRALGMVNSG